MARAATERSLPSHQISPSSDAKLATEKFRWLFLISIKLQVRQNRLAFFEGVNTPIGSRPMRDGFPHSVAVALGLMLAFGVSLFFLAAMAGITPH
jgi:hypothetical protein